MKKNYISQYMDTHFYINLGNHTYGVCVNIKDEPNAQKIIDKVLKDRKQQIEAWENEWEEGAIRV